MNFGQAFTYVFEDPDWLKKVLIPALISLIPIVGQIYLIGWALDISRRVIQHNPRPLPDVDFGRQLGEGFKGFVVGLVYAIPILILEIPIIIASLLTSNQNMDPNTVAPLVTFVSLCCGGLIFLYAILLAFALPAAMGRLADSGSIGAALRFQEVFGLLRAAPGAYLMTLLGVMVAGMIASLGTIACVIGVVATLAYSQAIAGHLYGQAYLEATHNSGFTRG